MDLQIKLQKEEERQQKITEKKLKQEKREQRAYVQKSKLLTELRNDYKDLIVAQGGTSKESKKLLKEVQKLDKELKELDETVGQNQRSVGEYEKATEKLGKAAKSLGIVALVVKGFEMLRDQFGNTRDGALVMEKAMNRLGAVISVTTVSIANSWKGLKGIWEAFSASFSIKINDIKIAYLELKQALTFDDDKELAIQKQIDQLNEESKNLLPTVFKLGASWETLTGAWDDYGKRIEDTIENMDGISKMTQDYDIKIQALTRSISDLNREQRINLLIAENDTLAFDTRIKASEKAVKQAEELGKAQKRLAYLELDLQRETLEAQFKKQGILKQSEEATTERLIQLLKDRAKAGKVASDQEQAFTDAYVEFQNAKLEASDVLLDTLEKQNKLFSDLRELELDILIDGADAQKTINERIIANEAKSFEERRKLLEENEKLNKKSYEAQKDTVIELNNQVIKSERTRIANSTELTEAQKQEQLAELKRQEEVLKGAKIDEILAEKDATVQAEKLLALKLNEKFTLRLFQLIKDQKTAELDLIETKENILKQEQEIANNREQIAIETKKRKAEIEEEAIQEELDAINENEEEITRKQLEAQAERQEELYNQKEELIEEQYDAEIEALKKQADFEIEQAGDNAEKIKEIEEQLALDLLNANKEKNEALKENNKEREEDAEKTAKKIAEIEEANMKRIRDFAKETVDQILEKRVENAEKEVENADENISAQEKRLEEQRERAQQGLDNSLEYEQEALAEAELKKIEAEKKKVRAEKIQALWTSYQANASNPEPGIDPVTKTLIDFARLEAVTASFQDGGIVGIDGYDHIKTAQGITMGKSHNVDGGTLAYHQNGEGFFSRDEVSNMGLNNFYALKNYAKKGKMRSNFINDQLNDINTSKAFIIQSNNEGVEKRLDALGRKFERFEKGMIDVEDISANFLKIITTKTKGNRTTTKERIVNKREIK